MLVGVPVLLALLTFVLRPLQRRQAEQREESGRLTTLGADTVAGLRVLRGIGGEQTFLRRYEEQSQRVRVVGIRVAGVQATLDAAQVLLPGVFVVLVTWLGARFALDGRISAGRARRVLRLLRVPRHPAAHGHRVRRPATRAHIGARKMIRVLAVEPDQEPDVPGRRRPPRGACTTPARTSRCGPGA